MMSKELTIKFSDKQFPFYLRRSFYVHALLLSLTLISGKVIIEKRREIQEKNLQLVEASVRVDMVSMPKFTLNELKNVSSGVEEAKKEEAAPVADATKAEAKVEEKVEPKEEVKENSKELAFQEESKKKRQDFLSKLKEIGSKKVKGDGNVKAEKGLGGEKATALKNLALAGNKLSAGVAITGNGNTADLKALQLYAAKLPTYVRQKWNLPTYLAKNKELKCRVRIWLADNGSLLKAEIYESSGEPEYDQRALSAVRDSNYPRLSDEIKEDVRGGKIVLGFPL